MYSQHNKQCKLLFPLLILTQKHYKYFTNVILHTCQVLKSWWELNLPLIKNSILLPN